MEEYLSDYYLWIKSGHIIAVISWMAGLLYLPRLFVYHTQVAPGSGQDQLFQVMEAKLLRIIMNPAMIISWIFGLMLLADDRVVGGPAGWLHGKIAAVVALTAFHMILARYRRLFASGKNTHEEKFYRRINEVPTLLMILIVILVVVKPL